MVSGNGPGDSLLNSLQFVKDALSPLELCIKKATKNLEFHWFNPNCDENAEFLGHVNVKNSKIHKSVLNKKNSPSSPVIDEERGNGLFIKLPMETILGMFSPNPGSSDNKGNAVKQKIEESCSNCFVQLFQSPVKLGNKGCSKSEFLHESEKREIKKVKFATVLRVKDTKCNEVKPVSLDLLIGFVFYELARNISKISKGIEQNGKRLTDFSSDPSPPRAHLNSWKAVISFLEGRKADVNLFLGNSKFARVGEAASTLTGVTSPLKEDSDDSVTPNLLPHKLGDGWLSIPLPNVKHLKTTLSNVSITELIELVPQLLRSPKDVPDKKKLFSVQDFFRYTKAEGKRFFEELDRDGDGQVNLEDLEIAMRKRKLPGRYAREFMRRARSHLFAKSFGWTQFLTLMEQKEPTILRAYTSLCLSKSGTLQKSEILASLENAGLPANEDNAVAMMRFLNADSEGSISYAHFRNFMLCIPSDRLQDDPRNLWFEAATVVPVAPPVEMPAGSVLRSALAGGLASGLSASLLHPIDTIKTRVQTSTLSFPEVISRVPQIGTQGLYRGSIPAIFGQFISHGLRTGIFEASKLVLIKVAPNLPDIQVQSLASFCSTLLGTATRIPCEVLKQRLQAGLFDNVGQAIVGTWQQDGLKGFFRGTGVTLCREVPLYVAGMGLYAESKKLAQHLLRRELEPWETIAIGALSGGIAAVITTPFDVLKTRMMTAPHGQSISTSILVFTILRNEGPLGFFKGAIPRFFWVAPLGAMNFAGYELAKKAMTKSEEELGDELPGRKN